MENVMLIERINQLLERFDGYIPELQRNKYWRKCRLCQRVGILLRIILPNFYWIISVESDEIPDNEKQLSAVNVAIKDLNSILLFLEDINDYVNPVVIPVLAITDGMASTAGNGLPIADGVLNEHVIQMLTSAEYRAKVCHELSQFYDRLFELVHGVYSFDIPVTDTQAVVVASSIEETIDVHIRWKEDLEDLHKELEPLVKGITDAVFDAQRRNDHAGIKELLNLVNEVCGTTIDETQVCTLDDFIALRENLQSVVKTLLGEDPFIKLRNEYSEHVLGLGRILMEMQGQVYGEIGEKSMKHVINLLQTGQSFTQQDIHGLKAFLGKPNHAEAALIKDELDALQLVQLDNDMADVRTLLNELQSMTHDGSQQVRIEDHLHRLDKRMHSLFEEFQSYRLYNESSHIVFDNDTIRHAVNMWCTDPAQAESMYGHISTWDTSAVTNMDKLFLNKPYFNDNINQWNTKNVTSMSELFSGASEFNQPLNNWQTSKVTTMNSVFYAAASFNQPLSDWNTSKVTTMSAMFQNAVSFNQSVADWDVHSVQSMDYMFFTAESFNQPLANWKVDKVTNMQYMFYSATSFNQCVNNWNVSSVTDMGAMFYGASSFNQPLNNWDVGNVTQMYSMFQHASIFNQPLSSWNVAKVIDMERMFRRASCFNQSLDKWNVHNVLSFECMFYEASSFQYRVSQWKVKELANLNNMFDGSYVYHDEMLTWEWYVAATNRIAKWRSNDSGDVSNPVSPIK